MLTSAEVVYYVIQFNNIPSLVLEPGDQQLMSFALAVLGLTIAILVRITIRACVAVMELVLVFTYGRMFSRRERQDVLPTLCMQIIIREKQMRFTY